MCCTAVYGRGKKPKQSHSSLNYSGRPDCGGGLLVQEVVFANGNGREGMCFCKPERGHWDQFRYACRGCLSPLRCSIQRRRRSCAIIQSNIFSAPNVGFGEVFRHRRSLEQSNPFLTTEGTERHGGLLPSELQN